MDGACSTHGKEEKCVKVWSETLQGRDLGIDGKYLNGS